MDDGSDLGLLQGESSGGFLDYLDNVEDPGETQEHNRDNLRPLDDDGWPLCLECGERIEEYSGSGRRPKYHPEHRPSVMGKATGKPRATRSGTTDKSLDAKLKKVASDLADNIALTGALLTPVLPLTGTIMARDAEDTANGIVKIARNNPKMLAAIIKANQISPGVTIAKSLITLGVAAMVDTKRIDERSQLSIMLGVFAVAEELAGTRGEPIVVTPPPASRII